MKLRKFLHDSGARIATQLYGNQHTYFDAVYMSTYWYCPPAVGAMEASSERTV
jgi:hypothetical protein